jgi:pyrimidine operon attenuation protein/uracil phosphoribosyltransferase
MIAPMNMLLSAERLYQELLSQLRNQYARQSFELLGLASGGALIAQRLAGDLQLNTYGIVNVSFYRDDYADKGVKAFNSTKGMATSLPYNVNDAYIIIVDDVLDTGRTVRAALNELFDYGRPAKVDVAVLVDLHRRELPINARFKGGEIDLPFHHILEFSQDQQGLFGFSQAEKPSSTKNR